MAGKSGISQTVKRLWQSGRFRTALTFLVFVVCAAVFWLILALNDSVQKSVAIRLRIENVPDSVTFINLPPERIHVMVRDQGLSLLRNGILSDAEVSLNFKDYSSKGWFRIGETEMAAALKSVFGSSATLMSSSVDSLRCLYTTLPGKRVPIQASVDIQAASGKVIRGIKLDPTHVTVFSTRDILDTITRVFTQKVTRRNLEESGRYTADLRGVSGVRIIPSKVSLEVSVEPLVRKESDVHIKVEHTPDNVDLLLFPQKVSVIYYVPMSRFSDTPDFEVWVDYREIASGKKSLPVHLGKLPADVYNADLKYPEVEYVVAHE